MLILRIGVLRRDQKLPGRDLVAAVCGRDDDHWMSCTTKAISLNSHLSVIPKPAKARAKSLGSKSDVSQLDEERPPHRFLNRNVQHLLMSLMCVGLVTAVLLPLDRKLALNLIPIAYLIPVIIAATQWGIWPATLASVAGTGAADFFFLPPYYSFQVDDPQEAVDLLLFLVVALVSSNLASRLRRETEALRQREKEIQQLYEFSRRLAACFTVSDLISAIQNYLSRALGQQAAFFVAMADRHFEPPKSGSVPKVVQESVASMIAKIGVPARTIVDEPTQNVWLIRAVGSETTVHGLVAVNIGSGRREVVDSKTRRVEAILEEVSLTLQRLDIEKAMEDARLHLQAQLLRDAFHGTLSHELRSPLAAIRGSASVLDSMPLIRGDDRIHSLVEAISDEVAELDGFIQNLLSATRVTASGISPRLEWADPRDIVDAAIRRRERRLSAHKVEIEFAEDLPLVNVDSGLIEESLWTASGECGQILPVRLNDLGQRAGRTRTRYPVDLRSGRRDNTGRTAAAWPQVIPQPAPSGHHSRIRSGILDRVDLREGERRHHRHVEPRARAGSHGLHCPARISDQGLTG